MYVKCGRGKRIIHIWPSWILVRLMTVCRERDCGKDKAIWSRGEVCEDTRRTLQWGGDEGGVESR